MSISSSSKIFLLLTAAGLTACSSETKTAAEVQSVNAPVEKVVAASLPELRSVPGSVRAGNAAMLSVKSVGTVTRVHVKEGDRIRTGQVLLEVDDRDVRAGSDRARAGSVEVEKAIEGADAAVRAAEANARLAEATFKRFSALRERGSVSPQEFDEVNSRYVAAQAELSRAQQGRAQAVASRDSARAAVAQANAWVDFARVRAPFDGIVTARLVDPGAQAAPGVPLLAVEQSGSSRVEATVDETLASVLRAGDEALVRIGDREFKSPITQVVAAVDPGTRGALVKIALPAREDLRSGSYATVSFAVGQRKAFTVPQGSIVARGSLTNVFVVDGEGLARLRLVTTGRAADGRVEILSGVDDGDVVVTAAPATLRDGVRVTSGVASNNGGKGERS